jgi:uncharacterized protein YggT (Ycf19 family)
LYIIAQIISAVCNVLIFMLLARSVLSWIVYSGNQYNPTLGRIFQFLTSVTEPVVAPVRRLISRFFNTRSVDFAPVVTFFIIIIVQRILVRALIG